MSNGEAIAGQSWRSLISCALIALALWPAAVADADTLSATFDVPAPGAPPPGSSPWARLNLSLNANDTISGSLNLTQGFTTSTFCFNVVGSNAGFTITGLPSGWFGSDTGSPFGCGATGFGDFNSYIIRGDGPSRASISFTIERSAGFSSVYDMVELSSFTTTPVDFTVDVFSGNTVGLAGAIVPTPESRSALLLVIGLFGVVIWEEKTGRKAQAMDED